jgi:hypothetical protein
MLGSLRQKILISILTTRTNIENQYWKPTIGNHYQKMLLEICYQKMLPNKYY